ncbi:MAG: RNA pseudouridine synthase [Candidatus Falkowbacteria bacterium]
MLKYKTIFENENFLIINKPAGLITHGGGHIKEKSLVDQLLKEYPEIKNIGEDPDRPGIMHRLDKLASGLLVIAKTQEMFEHLKKQFQNRTVSKTYTALVYGKIEKDEDEITFPIKRSSKGTKMAALPNTNKGKTQEEGREAITGFEIIKKYINYTLLKVKIKTGRTHQIRVHMSAYGHPIAGDDLYGTKKTKEKNHKLNLERIFLNATELSFMDLDNKKQKFKIDLPEDFKKFLKIVK